MASSKQEQRERNARARERRGIDKPGGSSDSNSGSSSNSNSSSNTKTEFRPEQGMFGLNNIMQSFYDYEPASDDEYGNYMKNTFAGNMIQSAFDTQNAKDLAYTQAEISSGMMNQAAELQRLNTKDIMRKEYQYGTDMMKQQFDYQSEFADDQYSRDLGMVNAMSKEQRETDTNKLRVTGDEERKTLTHTQDLKTRNRNEEHRMARNTARAF